MDISRRSLLQAVPWTMAQPPAEAAPEPHGYFDVGWKWYKRWQRRCVARSGRLGFRRQQPFQLLADLLTVERYGLALDGEHVLLFHAEVKV